MLLALPVIGTILGLVCGGKMRALATLRLRGEPVLIVALLAQWALPLVHAAMRSPGPTRWFWMAALLGAAAVCIVNRRLPGLSIAALGLLMNASVIVLNGGMPVLPEAVVVAGGSIDLLPNGDLAHGVLTGGTMLSVLGDVLPLAAGEWLRGVASAGDVVLGVGVATLLSARLLGRAGIPGRAEKE